MLGELDDKSLFIPYYFLKSIYTVSIIKLDYKRRHYRGSIKEVNYFRDAAERARPAVFVAIDVWAYSTFPWVSCSVSNPSFHSSSTRYLSCMRNELSNVHNFYESLRSCRKLIWLWSIWEITKIYELFIVRIQNCTSPRRRWGCWMTSRKIASMSWRESELRFDLAVILSQMLLATSGKWVKKSYKLEKRGNIINKPFPDLWHVRRGALVGSCATVRNI